MKTLRHYPASLSRRAVSAPKRIIGYLRTWRRPLIQRTVIALHFMFRRLPIRVVFGLLTLHEYLKLPAKSPLRVAFTPVVASRILEDPSFVLSSAFTEHLIDSSIRVLYFVGAQGECCDIISTTGLGLLSSSINEIWARSLFELGRFRLAREALDASLSKQMEMTRPYSAQLKGYLELIAGDESEAVHNLDTARSGIPRMFCPHQNIAARYDDKYLPTTLDMLSGSDGLLFDAYNFIGQRVTHVGEGQLCAALYGGALRAQRRLSATPPRLTSELRSVLARLDIEFHELRILPVEWFVQIGHQGMLDMLFRMREIGWWSGKVIFLMPRSMVANGAFQRLFERMGHVLVPGDHINQDVARELFSLQRWCGMAFNGFELPSGEVVPWQEAGAQMMHLWEKEGRGDPVREEFDRIYGSNEAVTEFLVDVRKHWGLKPEDWYVCLHVRDASHYGEMPGTGQTHRNSDMGSYLKTLRYITDQGGWVIKMGGPQSPALPKMDRVIDYARDATKSDLIDVHLIRNARYFIGTTSGLTNVAISLGTPCALVNCVTTDAQLWNSRVRFALKRVRLRNGAHVSQRELTSAPWRWRAFGSEVLARHGAILFENTPDEILETVKEVESLAEGRMDRYISKFPEAADLLSRWRRCLALPHFYGNSQPSVYYLKEQEAFLRGPDRDPCSVD